MAKGIDTLTVALVLSIISIVAVIALVSGAIGGGSVHTITVSASGTAYGYPDQGTIYMYLNGTGKSPSSANANLTGTVDAIGAALAPYLNNNMSLIQTQSYNIYKGKILLCTNITRGPTVNLPAPFYCSSSLNYTSLYCCYNQTAYIAAQSVVATIPNINNVSSAFSSVSNIPNVYSQSLSQKISDKQGSMLLNLSLEGALANATAQAQALAGSANNVRVLNVSVSGGPIYYPTYFANGASASSSGSSFFAGRIGVTRSVSVVFGVTPK
ncbi:MAG: SIMPL domain-containing protein [Candidatus Micrarchaeota archaeon]|nr:SIMPL domain-containing protein [Candidatus Micrarchaeota archaeon]